MVARKQYADIDTYINKLKRVMERLNVSQYDYDWTKNSAYVKFFYKNQWYQFDHTVEKANASGKMHLIYGTDVFAQLVLALEDLSRTVERGIYDLSVWVSGMAMIEQKPKLPDCFTVFGFEGPNYPSLIDLRKVFKEKAKEVHPDSENGSEKAFLELSEAFEQCQKIIETGDE